MALRLPCSRISTNKAISNEDERHSQDLHCVKVNPRYLEPSKDFENIKEVNQYTSKPTQPEDIKCMDPLPNSLINRFIHLITS